MTPASSKLKLQAVACCVVLAGVCCVACAQAEAEQTLAQRAAKLYSTAMSQYHSAGQRKQGVQLLGEFVKMYPTHENVPAAHMTIADYHRRIEDFDGCEAALDEVIRRFYSSGAWFRAYHEKLQLPTLRKDPERYLSVLAELARRAGRVPVDLRRNMGGHSPGWHYTCYVVYGPEHAEKPQFAARRGWIRDVADVADTPERAQNALRILEPSLRARREDLPADWQYAHVLLLRKAGKAEEAEKALQEYLDDWGDDPRGMSLWLFQLEDAQARKDAKAEDEIHKTLMDKYGGSASLEPKVYRRLSALARQGRYDEFVELARHYLKTYASPVWHGGIFQLRIQLAQAVGEDKKDTSRITETLQMLEAIPLAGSPGRSWTLLTWRIELYCRLGNFEQAAKLAEQLVDEQHWSASSYAWVKSYVRRNEAFKKVVEAAEKKWSVPAADPQSKAPAMLKDLQARLKEDQIRHAEEIGEEMFTEHRDDAATIEAVRAMVEYYFRKVMREPRDKWIERMIKAYPYHPLTEAVLSRKIETEQAEQRSKELLASLDMMMERFPTARNWRWHRARLDGYGAIKDPEGKLEFVRLVYGKLAEEGDVGALMQLAGQETLGLKGDNNAAGDYWMAWAGKLAGKRAAIYCLAKAYDWYRRGNPERRIAPNWDGAMAAVQGLQTQQLDPEVRWKMAFADINVLAYRGDGKAAVEALRKRLGPKQKHRDLSLRLDMLAVGGAIVQAKMSRQEGMALIGRLRASTSGRRDTDALEIMQGNIYKAVQNNAVAAEHFLRVVDRSPWPIVDYWSHHQAVTCLRQAKSPNCGVVMDNYIKRIGNAQDLAPQLLYELGAYYLGARNPAALRIRDTLVRSYPASGARDRLDQAIANAQEQHRKKGR